MSPGYPNSYPNSISCVFEIVQPTGKAILLNFIDFDMKNSAPSACDLSYIEIRDGDNENSTLIGKYCDKSNLPEVILSKYNYMWIKFTNENIFKAVKKFKANYTSVDIKCGGILKEFVGTLSTPNQVGLAEYSSGIKCEWILSAPPGYVVQITWMTFRLELSINCTYDSVQIYDNNTDTNMGGLMGRFCGSKLPPTLLSSSNLVTIIFSTDATITSDGFVASYTFVQEKNGKKHAKNNVAFISLCSSLWRQLFYEFGIYKNTKLSRKISEKYNLYMDHNCCTWFPNYVRHNRF